ncbi:hypothetical protein [Jatrophihabitans sp.]|uniref:hypothetical protein n=1 Tax=Jatrophihabitans sp. TaxID=1932789 RepID=UPI002BB6F567|nr:hypothetical protein [Jatrophihabitans sp.]
MGEDQWRDDLFIDCPTGGSLSVAEARALIAAFIHSHPVLRSVITDQDATPRQRIVGAGSLDLVVVSGVSTSWADLDGWVPRLAPDELPVSGALVIEAALADGDPALAAAVTRIVLRVSHRAADWWGIRLLRADLAERVRAAEQGGQLEPPRRSLSPADVVAWELSPDGQAVNDQAAAYLVEQLAGAPPTMFPRAPLSYTGDRYWYGELRSTALLHALAELYRRERVLPVTAFAGALAFAAGVATGVARPVLRIWSANRFNRAWRDYPGPLSQIGVLRVEVDPDELLANWSRLNAAVLKACLHSRREPPDMGEGRDQIGLNVLLGQRDLAGAGQPAATAESTFSWTGSRADGEDLGVFVLAYRYEDEVVVQVRIGADVISKLDTELMLRGMEWAIVHTASRDAAPDLREYRTWLTGRERAR